MNKDWSERNKRMQGLLKKTDFDEGIGELLLLREELLREMFSWRGLLSERDWSAMPFINAEGYHSKTVAYSLWHIFRIEDIVVNTLIRKREEILFEDHYREKTGSPIITTGNELVREQIGTFSERLDIGALYEYALAVKESTDVWLKTLVFSDLKTAFGDADREAIRALGVVSTDERAEWLIGYWCEKDLGGLIRMPLSRHWIMHTEAAGRIIKKLKG